MGLQTQCDLRNEKFGLSFGRADYVFSSRGKSLKDSMPASPDYCANQRNC